MRSVTATASADRRNFQLACDRLLCVEDNPANARLVEILLARRSGMRLTIADTGKRALDLAFELQPDLVLLDLNLPEISGLDVLRALRNDDRTRDTKIIMVSAHALPEHIDELRAAGADDYITKPCDISHFLAVVNRILTTPRG